MVCITFNFAVQFQTVLVFFLAIVLKWNKMLAFAFSNISFPPLIPFIIYASLHVGSFFVKGKENFSFYHNLTFESIKYHTFQYLVGSFILATISAITFGLCSYFLLSLKGKSNN